MGKKLGDPHRMVPPSDVNVGEHKPHEYEFVISTMNHRIQPLFCSATSRYIGGPILQAQSSTTHADSKELEQPIVN